MTEHVSKPVTESSTKDVPTSSRLTRLKTAFLYVLIAGLAAAALTSVFALLIGQFNSSIVKSLLTITTFFTHSLLILALLWADRHNQVGRHILPTTLITLVFANMITSTLGTWEIISNVTAWRCLGFYFLIMGAAFIIVGILRLRIAQQATQVALNVTAGLIAATVLSVAPWVLQVVNVFDPLYFRVVAALSILAATAFIISIIIRGIALGNNDSLKLTAPVKEAIPGGLLAIYITVAVITGMVWLTGFTSFMISGIDASNPSPYDTNRYY